MIVQDEWVEVDLQLRWRWSSLSSESQLTADRLWLTGGSGRPLGKLWSGFWRRRPSGRPWILQNQCGFSRWGTPTRLNQSFPSGERDPWGGDERKKATN